MSGLYGLLSGTSTSCFVSVALFHQLGCPGRLSWVQILHDTTWANGQLSGLSGLLSVVGECHLLWGRKRHGFRVNRVLICAASCAPRWSQQFVSRCALRFAGAKSLTPATTPSVVHPALTKRKDMQAPKDLEVWMALQNWASQVHLGQRTVSIDLKVRLWLDLYKAVSRCNGSAKDSRWIRERQPVIHASFT